MDPWMEKARELTPVEERNGMLFKREDMFALLGFGGINGSKCRQRIWVVDNYIQKGGAGAVIAAASVKSPQLSTAAVIAKHYGRIPSPHVVQDIRRRKERRHI